ncbi:GTPase domain-containing protein [Actinokineospora auranticolor]|uniref:Uncharacterized protein n=1 Tax=Actinokineospora auranticolor TaxID=155976 RepID=A0A2S6GEY7_9PSEU|nr:GTPase domain-containing protein [Actinokineospora auranticolor]PPK63782.1 hypothetical protein CLV40_12422 [Actinokineospora auranticolor]
MTDPNPSPPRRVRCPICADDIPWAEERFISVYNAGKNQYEHIDVSRMPESKRADLARNGFRQCPNPSEDTSRHFLPATYGDYGSPLVVGLIGAPDCGKTHLLTAMIREAYLNGLAPYGITVKALDFVRHEKFHKDFIQRLEKGEALPGTETGIADAADILLLRGPAGTRPVTFFDVAGEDWQNTDARNRSTRFLVGATAAIFVHASEDPPDAGKPPLTGENRSFDLAVERLRAARLPAVVAVTKADRLRYLSPVDRWLSRGNETTVDPTRIRQESKDVYAHLHNTGAVGSLEPYHAFPRCALHFVSASGGDAVGRRPDGSGKAHFPRGFRPTRVLEPLVSLLAMTGMINTPEAAQVGAP